MMVVIMGFPLAVVIVLKRFYFIDTLIENK